MKYPRRYFYYNKHTFGLTLLILFALLIPDGAAMPPHPDVIVTGDSEVSESPGKFGANNPDPELNAPSKLLGIANSEIIGSFKALAVLIDFSDKASSVNPANFSRVLYVIIIMKYLLGSWILLRLICRQQRIGSSPRKHTPTIVTDKTEPVLIRKTVRNYVRILSI